MVPIPRLGDTLLIGDDPYILAELVSLIARPRTYTPVLDGPRMNRSDADIEVTLRNNAAARSKARYFILAGLSDESAAELQSLLPAERTFRVTGGTEALASGVVRPRKEALRCQRTRLGEILLLALRQGRHLEFDDIAPQPTHPLSRDRRHLVVCEDGDLHAQVVAASYAFAFDADLALIPRVADDIAESLLAELYGVYEQRSMSATDAMRDIASELRSLSGLDPKSARSATFFTAKLPWGFGFPEIPTSHIFNYPSVGLTTLNGVLGCDRRVQVCVGLDPAQVQADEMRTVADTLYKRGVFVSVRRGPRASVREASRTIELYPYDLLIVSTHCGDADGWRWTYQYPDRSGRKRTLVVDVAISVAEIPNNENLEVIQYKKFISLDGVDWADREAKKRLPVGTAMLDYIELIRAEPSLEPVTKEQVDRVHGSAALKMFDGNYLAAVRTLADSGAPIIINNACSSWHELAARFAFADCPLYVGTLFSVSDTEAREVVGRLMEKYLGKPIPLGLWHAQREIYGDSPRRPYAAMGVFFQPLRTATSNAPRKIAARLARALGHWKGRLKDTDITSQARFTMSDYVHYLETELTDITARWLQD